jgi:acetylglutamate kinase
MYILKIGGNILDNPVRLQRFLIDFAQLPGPKLLVHGGGKIASTIGLQLDIEETLRLVTMVYAGLINKNVVAQLQALNCNAIGMTGADANAIPATKRPLKTIDYGFVGDVAGPETINTAALQALLQAGLTPVFAPLTHDSQGSLLNTNADTIASVLATALAPHYQVKLVYCFEKKGVLANAEDDDSVIPSIDQHTFKSLKEKGVIKDGMIPKLDNAFAALQQGVKAVLIGEAEALRELADNGHFSGTTLQLRHG